MPCFQYHQTQSIRVTGNNVCYGTNCLNIRNNYWSYPVELSPLYTGVDNLITVVKFDG